MEAPSIRVRHAVELWPGVPGSPGTLPPAALSFTLDGEDVMSTQVVRQWVADGDTWFSAWPGRSGAENCCTHLCSLGELGGEGHEVWGERMRLDQSDQLLCRLGGDGRWIVSPGDGLDGALSGAMAIAMRELLLAERLPFLGDGEVVALPGPPSDDLVSDDLAQRSWHARAGEHMVRALESPPLRDFETSRLRARHLQLVTRASAVAEQPGQLLWIDQEFRVFAQDDVPGLDQPRAASGFGPAVELLVEELRRTPWMRDEDLA